MAVNAYRTVLGQTIHFGDLPTNQVCVIHEVLEEKRKHEPPQAQASGPESFAVAARKWITAEYPHDADFLRALRGPIGEVYRDCYYRLLAETVSGGDPEARSQFFENLRSSPARVLYDRYLEGGYTQAELARAADLHESTVSRLFSQVRDPGAEEDSSVKLQRFQEACAKLSLTLVGVNFKVRDRDRGFEESSIVRTADDFTVRERQLLRLVAAAVRYLFGESATAPAQEKKDACLVFLALHLSVQYGIDDIDVLDRFSRAFLDEITRARDLRRDAFPVLTEEALKHGHTLLEHLLVGFQLGINSEEGHVLLSSEESAKLLQHPRMDAQEEAPTLDPALQAYGSQVRQGWRTHTKVFKKWYQLRFKKDLPERPSKSCAGSVRAIYNQAIFTAIAKSTPRDVAAPSTPSFERAPTYHSVEV